MAHRWHYLGAEISSDTGQAVSFSPWLQQSRSLAPSRPLWARKRLQSCRLRRRFGLRNRGVLSCAAAPIEKAIWSLRQHLRCRGNVLFQTVTTVHNQDRGMYQNAFGGKIIQ